MSIPSALKLLVNVFTDPREQAWAIGLFGGCSAVASCEDSDVYLIMHDEPHHLHSLRSPDWCNAY